MNRTRWGVAVWMPYDNNLSVYEESILTQLRRGTQPDVAVAVQVDRPGNRPMERFAFLAHDTLASEAGTADGSSAEALGGFLSWAGSTVAADRWALVFLGHGGRVNEFSPDDDTDGDGRSTTRRWMGLDEARDAIGTFAGEQEVALVFLQNCCKGTLEANYTFRDTSPFTLSSQTVLGAPNYYYGGALRYLQDNPDTDGAGLGEAIIDNERPDMFSGYCLVDNSALATTATLLDEAIAHILSDPAPTLDLAQVPQYTYGAGSRAEKLADLRKFAEAIRARTPGASEALDALLAHYDGKLIRHYRESPRAWQPGLSGLSLILPTSQAQVDSNLALDLYRDTRLGILFSRVLSTELAEDR